MVIISGALEARLQGEGIAAARVQSGVDVASDAQLSARGHFLELPHPDGGTTSIEASRFRLSETPAIPGRDVPILGRDNDSVLRDILRYDDDRIAELVMAGALD